MSIIMVSCKEKEDVCKACNEAIDHMAIKIADNSCNPNFMQSAADRIKLECSSNNPDQIIGYLAENCTFNYKGYVRCTEVANGFRTLDVEPRTIAVKYYIAKPNDTISVTVSGFSSYEFGYSTEVTTAGSSEIVYQGANGEGTNLYILMINKLTTDTIYTGLKTIRYHRPNQWHLKRTLKVEYNQNLMGYTVDFENW